MEGLSWTLSQRQIHSLKHRDSDGHRETETHTEAHTERHTHTHNQIERHTETHKHNLTHTHPHWEIFFQAGASVSIAGGYKRRRNKKNFD